MLHSQFQIHNGLVKVGSIIKMLSKKWKRVDYVEDAMQGLHSQQRHVRYLEKRIRTNEEKSCDIENYDINSLLYESISSSKHTARAHVLPNKKPELSIYWCSI